MQVTVHQVSTEADFAICMALRMEIFVFEQDVPAETEWDAYDRGATHFLARVDGKPAGTARLRETDSVARIERMAVRSAMRRHHVGTQLLQFVMDHARSLGFTRAVISAQTQAVPFYETLGFKASGSEYMEAGIPHYAMARDL